MPNVNGPVNGVLWYPRVGDGPQYITVSLYDVRAAEDLIIRYDYDRDGWSIARADAPAVELSFIRVYADPSVLPPGKPVTKMRTEHEIRAWLADLETYQPASSEQAIGLAGSISALNWVLDDRDEAAK